MRVLPYDDTDIYAILSELARVGVIVRYEADTTRVIQATNFGKHQRPHPEAAPLLLPELAVKKHGKPRKTRPAVKRIVLAG